MKTPNMIRYRFGNVPKMYIELHPRGYFYVWALYFTEGDAGSEQQLVIEMPDL